MSDFWQMLHHHSPDQPSTPPMSWRSSTLADTQNVEFTCSMDFLDQFGRIPQHLHEPFLLILDSFKGLGYPSVVLTHNGEMLGTISPAELSATFITVLRSCDNAMQIWGTRSGATLQLQLPDERHARQILQHIAS
ncbi:hypothetical protein BAQU_0559 [Bifidobacterium aquikefiri]|uniref:Uncharacterized protein n=2 Tax=Bifidobacterium aquikefiri TaxID=1653207 RepID=A0A261G936_9BIFI|nr:hypothetical protein BAQU_0559 [Bifidobacterium aquikefiri]